jgi:beta-N-acetylhexosaminidase
MIFLIIVFLAVGCSSTEELEVAPHSNETKGSNSKSEIINNDKSNDTIENKSVDTISAKLNKLTLEQKIGQLLMPDFRKWNGKNVTILDEGIASLIKEYHIGGVILFRENFVNRNQTKNMINQFQSHAQIPLMFAVDQEGGLVTRLPFAPRMPGNMALGATGDTGLARDVGIAIGSELRELGIHINFGPVVDINNNPDNPVIGVRSFGDNKEEVAAMGLAYMHGLNDAGIAAVAKHFPGHGDVDLDSHYILPSSEKGLEQLYNLELHPFQALIDENVQGIMTAHITFDQIEPEMVTSQKDGLPIELPATLSSTIMTNILREQMGFQGLIFTDAMDMKAITDHFGPIEAAVRAIEAGVDIVLMPDDLELVYHGIIKAVESGRLSEERIDQSVARVLLFKESQLFKSDNTIEIDVAEAQEIEQRVANASITLVHNDGFIPLKENEGERIALVATSRGLLRSLENAVKPYRWRIEPILLDKNTNWSGSLTIDQKQRLKNTEKVFIVTNTATSQDRDIAEWQLKTIQSVIDQEIPAIVIAARNPYDMVVLQGMESYIAQYDTGTASFKATVDVIFGKMNATGKLPIILPD